MSRRQHSVEIQPDSPVWKEGCWQQCRCVVIQIPNQLAAQICSATDVRFGDSGEHGRFGVADQTCSARQQGQVGYGGRQVQLEFRLGAAKVACLPDPQLGQTVFYHTRNW